jgi:hypothetical protein
VSPYIAYALSVVVVGLGLWNACRSLGGYLVGQGLVIHNRLAIVGSFAGLVMAGGGAYGFAKASWWAPLLGFAFGYGVLGLGIVWAAAPVAEPITPEQRGDGVAEEQPDARPQIAHVRETFTIYCVEPGTEVQLVTNSALNRERQEGSSLVYREDYTDAKIGAEATLPTHRLNELYFTDAYWGPQDIRERAWIETAIYWRLAPNENYNFFVTRWAFFRIATRNIKEVGSVSRLSQHPDGWWFVKLSSLFDSEIQADFLPWSMSLGFFSAQVHDGGISVANWTQVTVDDVLPLSDRQRCDGWSEHWMDESVRLEVLKRQSAHDGPA